MSHKKSFLNAALTMVSLFGGEQMYNPKIPAKDKREIKDKRPYIAPRSMTEAEKEYYAKHKSLNGFKE